MVVLSVVIIIVILRLRGRRGILLCVQPFALCFLGKPFGFLAVFAANFPRALFGFPEVFRGKLVIPRRFEVLRVVALG